MNWKIRSDDGKQAVLDIGDWGGLVLRGGYQPPPARRRPVTADAAGWWSRRRAAAVRVPPRNAAFDGFCWGIEPWDAKKVEAELRKRGLTPVADNHGKDFQSFHVKDPDGFDLQISNGSRKNRRQGAANGKTSAPAPFEPTAWKTVWLDHISFEVSNYKETVGVLPRRSSAGSREPTRAARTTCRDRRRRRHHHPRGGGGRRGAAPGTTPPARRGGDGSHLVRHHRRSIPMRSRRELEKRGLTRASTPAAGGDIHTAPYKSYHTTTPNGFDLQISATTRANRDTAEESLKACDDPYFERVVSCSSKRCPRSMLGIAALPSWHAYS